MAEDFVRIFDTTLRDGEQSAGVNLNAQEKLQIAHQLARAKVDVIEAGFPAASPGDLQGVLRIAEEVEGPIIAGLARTRTGDIDKAYEAVRHASKPRIHTFIATSDIHLEYKLRMTRQEVLEEVRRGVSHGRNMVEDVEFSAEDASRSDVEFLAEVFRTAYECGATTLNIPDTVGYGVPEEFGSFVARVIELANLGDGVIWSCHCHNDLGLATANSMAGVARGIRQIECAVNGLGERAGNAALEESVMALRTRSSRYGVDTRVDTTRLWSLSSLVSRLTGFSVPPNKAIVGSNAFAHEAGIHQHGVLQNRETYEIIKPEDVGAPGNRLVMGKHSGRHAFEDRLISLGFNLTKEEIARGFQLFKNLCDRKEMVTDSDIEALVVDDILGVSPQRRYVMENLSVQMTPEQSTATVTLSDGSTSKTDAATGNGPVDATYAAIKRSIDLEPELLSYEIKAVTERSDAMGEARVSLGFQGVKAQGRGVSTDVIEASAKAYVNALNRLLQLYEVKKGGSVSHG